MIWRLCHRLFGWDYVAFMFGYSWHICRVRTFPNGKKYFKCYGIHFLEDQTYVRELT